MTLREAVFNALTSGSPPLRAYPEVLPQEIVLPAITFFEVSGSDELNLRGSSSLIRRLVQVDVWATVARSADSIAQEVKGLMLAATTFNVGAISVSGAPTFEEYTRRYRVSREFSVWMNE